MLELRDESRAVKSRPAAGGPAHPEPFAGIVTRSRAMLSAFAPKLAGADCLLTPCPVCQMQLDMHQPDVLSPACGDRPVPVLCSWPSWWDKRWAWAKRPWILPVYRRSQAGAAAGQRGR